MFIIADYIERLLCSNQRVVVPGLGTFVYRYCSAIETEEGITPPRNEILFSTTDSLNDGVLIRALIKERKIPYQEAARLVTDEIDTLHEQLNQPHNQAVEFGSLGRFHRREEEIGFTEKENAQMNADFFGLVPVSLKRIDRTTLETAGAVTPEPAIVRKGDSIRISISRTILRRVAAAAAVVVLLMFVSQPISHTKSHTDYAQLLRTEMLKATGTPPEETEKKQTGTNEILSEANIPAQTAAPVEQKPTTVEPQNHTKQYAVIIASLPEKESAEAQLDLFKKKGYDQLEMVEKDGKYRIAYSICNTSEAAYQTVKELKSGNTIFTDAWVLPVKIR